MLDATLVKRASQAPSGAQVSATNQYLQHIRQTTNADEIFMMDAQGITIASTKNDNIGNSYRHSPIFSIAKAGTSGGFLPSACMQASAVITLASLYLSPAPMTWWG